MEKKIIFRINAPAVIWEKIEAEIIAINLENGFYYDISGLSASIWQMVNYHGYRDIITEIESRYGLTNQEAKTDVNFFLKTLEEEKLIEFADELMEMDACQDIHFPETYQKPVLNKYTDMQNLLLIDPIHEVDEHGWPNLYPLPENANESS